jgi:phospholipid N-methyltransferase
VSRIQDDRLIAHLGNACKLKEILSGYGLDAPDALISGIPFSTMKQSDASAVIEAISSILASNGRFVAYQVSSRVESLCHPFLGSGRMTLELLNIPPMRVYQWNKNGTPKKN